MVAESTDTELRRAVDACRERMRCGIEMPAAGFMAGRLLLMLGQAEDALAAYAAAVRSARPGAAGALEDEQRWLAEADQPKDLRAAYRWAFDFLGLAGSVRLSGASLRPPVLLVSGGAGSLGLASVATLQPLLEAALAGYEGTVCSGGTRVGVPGCVGAAAEAIGPRGKRPFQLVGYLPRVRPADAPTDERYDALVECGEQGFTPDQILRNWADVLGSGIRPDTVCVLGFGGGRLSAVEYRIALALGARVGLVEGSGGAVDALLSDDLWAADLNLRRLTCDRASIRAHAHPSGSA